MSQVLIILNLNGIVIFFPNTSIKNSEFNSILPLMLGPFNFVRS
jgi:hypothetical protein